ncbi:hypothetical protein HK104_004472 [Borealophlyctis nickersoniae]|nr:hypothetical protein HK104_004472 [Borealophlyctis nickersoniae]
MAVKTTEDPSAPPEPTPPTTQLSTLTLSAPTPANTFDEEDEEEDGWVHGEEDFSEDFETSGGYSALPDSLDDDEEEDEVGDGDGHGSSQLKAPVGELQTPVISLSEMPEAHIENDDLAIIRSVMASMPIPDSAIPEWAKAIPEERWMPRVVHEALEATEQEQSRTSQTELGGR